MIDYLYGSKSIGVRNYTHELYQHMTDLGVKINMCGAGGQHVLSHMNEQQLREHLIDCVSVSDSTVLHVQHDTLLFRGAGDMMEEMDNMCWFLERMLDRYERVFITFHCRVEFKHASWFKQPIAKLLIGMLKRKWYNQVISTLNRCTVLVHSMPHAELLRSQGCDTVQLFTHPTSRHTVNKPLDVENVRVVIPGKLVDRKRVGLAIETCTHIPNSVLTIDSTNIAMAEHYKTLAKTKQVDVEFIKWSMNTTEYLDQLSEHDVALVTYDEDVPLSGSVIDAIKCGLIVGTTATPSFQWFAKEFRCITTHNNLHTLGSLIHDILQDTVSRERLAWHADNYFYTSHESVDKLVDIYRGNRGNNQNKASRKLFASVVTESSQQTSSMPSYMINSSECEQLKYVDGMLHVEHQYRHNKKIFSRPWSGLIHGPFFEAKTTLSRPTVDVMIGDNAFDNCTKLQVTNSKLKEVIEPLIPCPVELIRLTNFPPVGVFDIKTFISRKTRMILHVGWWCKDFKSFNQLQLSEKWKKQLHVNVNEPTREFLDMYNITCSVCSSVPVNCLYYIDQITDDVVDEQMLYCICSNTPVLIRRNMTTEEYLGTDYALMFDDVLTAHELLTDDNIMQAYKQLENI